MRSLWRTDGRWGDLVGADAARSILVMSVSVLVIGMSYGASAMSAGLSSWQVVTIAATVLAGSSEFVFIGILAGGGAPLLAAATGLLVNTRNVGYGLAVGPHLGRGWLLAAGAHLINDESAALTTSVHDPRRARIVFFACGTGVLVAWPTGAWLGSVIGSVVAQPESLGLDAALPALLAALALPALRDRRTAVAAGVGGAVALSVAPFVPGGVPILLALSGLGAAALVRPTPSVGAAHAESVGSAS